MLQKDAKNRIFEEGFTAKVQGTGLGLFQAKHAIESNYGSIHIDSNGEGTTVSIRFFKA